jgi:hypothetical protein
MLYPVLLKKCACGPWSWISPFPVSMTISFSRSFAPDPVGAHAVTRASRATSERSSPVTSIPPFEVLTLRCPEGRVKVVRRIWHTWDSPQWRLSLSSHSPLRQLPDCCAAATKRDSRRACGSATPRTTMTQNTRTNKPNRRMARASFDVYADGDITVPLIGF